MKKRLLTLKKDRDKKNDSQTKICMQEYVRQGTNNNMKDDCRLIPVIDINSTKQKWLCRMRQCNLRQCDVARYAAVSQQAVSKWFSLSKSDLPTLENLLVIEQLFGYSHVDDLLCVHYIEMKIEDYESM